MHQISQKILIIDDEPDLLQVMGRVLKNEGYEVATENDGIAGVKKALEWQPQLILLDINMPKVSGLDICRKLKEHEVTREMSIILFTASGKIESKVSGLDFGADDYLIKDAHIEEIKARIRAQMRLKQMRDSLKASNRDLRRAHEQINRELETARSVQQGIYPKNIPDVRGLKLAVTLEQARQVGGDYYDIIQLSNSEVALLVVDVSGHDIASAFIVGMAKMSFNYHILACSEIDEVFNRVNADMLGVVKTDHYLTAFLAVVNTATGTFRYAKAGHCKQYRFDFKSGELQNLETRGMVIGSFEQAKFEEKKSVLFPGDKLICFTDGLLENVDPHGKQYGINRLETSIKQYGRQHLNACHRQILADQRQFCNGVPIKDDICLILAGMDPVGEPFVAAATQPGVPELFAGSGESFKRQIGDIISILDREGYPAQLSFHYQKLLNQIAECLMDGDLPEPVACQMGIKLTKNKFQIVLETAVQKKKSRAFFTSEACRILLLKFNREFGDFEMNEAGNRLVFNYETREKPIHVSGGKISLHHKLDGVYLTVPRNIDPSQTYEVLEADLIQQNVVNAEFKKIKSAFKKRSGRPVKISAPFQYFNAEKNRFFKFEAEPLKAMLLFTVTKLFPPPLSYEEILFILRKNGVVFGINKNTCRLAAEHPEPGKQYVLATGTPACNGKNAVIQERVPIDPTLSPLEKKDGSVDYKILDLISSVKKGTVILEKQPADGGKPGRSIFGRVIDPEPGKDLVLTEGENTEVTQSGGTLNAAVDGYIYRNREGIHVREILYIKNNVDYATGNIDFTGDVYVTGNVKSGFSITAGKNIWIQGITEGAKLKTSHGDIECRGGILGKGKAEIRARGNIAADFIQDAYLECGVNLKVSKSMLHVKARVQGDIRLENPDDGLILGGSLTCSGSVTAAIIGNEKEVKTEIVLRSASGSQVNDKLEQLLKRKKECLNLLLSLKSQIQTKKKLFKTRMDKTDLDREEIEKLLQAYYFTRQQTDTIEQQINHIRGNEKQQPKFGLVHILKAAFPNIIIRIGELEKRILRKHSAVTYQAMQDEIKPVSR